MNQNITFFNRQPTTGNSVDYIAMVNKNLQQDPTSVDPNSPVYLEAIKQYNGELKKGNTTRLSIPQGFCGYINPTSGEFRVRPDPDLQTIPPGQNIPTTTATATPTVLIEGDYPIDQCLSNGLAGSPAYSQTCTRESGEFGEYTKITNTHCGSDLDPVNPSGVNWQFIPVNYCIADLMGDAAQACMENWQEGGAGYEAAQIEGGAGSGDTGGNGDDGHTWYNAHGFFPW